MGVDGRNCGAQVTTLLSKAEQADKEPKVTEEELQALEADVSAQGQAVAAAKAVSLSQFSIALDGPASMHYLHCKTTCVCDLILSACISVCQVSGKSHKKLGRNIR